MKLFLLSIFIVVSSFAICQDKLYLLNGKSQVGKIIENSNHKIILNADNEKIEFLKSEVLLIEWLNGSCEIISTPTSSTTHYSNKNVGNNYRQNEKQKDDLNLNQISFNSLALCNADVTIFSERLLRNKRIGLGVMGAYNFNQYATALNANIAILANSKKNYDFGVFANLYRSKIKRRKQKYIGLMMLYTSFNYTSIKTDSVKFGNLVSVTANYLPAKSHQLSTLITFGSTRFVTTNFFIKTIFGFGVFKLHNDYKSEYNYRSNIGVSNPINVNSGVKGYLAINLGFKL